MGATPRSNGVYARCFFSETRASNNYGVKKLGALLQLQLLATSIGLSTAIESTSPPIFTLSPRQQVSLAELIHLTMDMNDDIIFPSTPFPSKSSSSSSSSSIGDTPTTSSNIESPESVSSFLRIDETELVCIEAIVRKVDLHFTTIAPKSVLSSLWSTDDGVPDETLATLTKSLRKIIDVLDSIFECEVIYDDQCSSSSTSSMEEQEAENIKEGCGVIWTGWSIEKQRFVARQVMNALIKACRIGKSANFKVTESEADQLLRLLTPIVFEAHSYIVLILFVLLATAGALVCVDTIVHKLMGRKSQRLIKVEKLLQSYNDCACYLCSGKLIRGNSIGEGGFGQVYLCTDQSSKEDRPKVVKMIGADFEKDVTVLQDALDEAKHLLSLKHRNVVRYYDVFVHRDVAGMKSRDQKRLSEDSDSTLTKKKKETNASASSWDWEGNNPPFENNMKSISSNAGKDSHYDYVCIVMEYCAGGTLLEYVASGVLLPLDVVVNTFLQVISALNHIHNKNIVHFDVKLENIFIARENISLKSPSTPKKRRRKKSSGSIVEPPPLPQETVNGYTIKVGDFGLAMRRQNCSTSSEAISTDIPLKQKIFSGSLFLSPSPSLPSPSLPSSPSSSSSSSPFKPKTRSQGSQLEVFPLLRQTHDAHQSSPKHLYSPEPLSLPRLELSRRATTKLKPKVVANGDDDDFEFDFESDENSPTKSDMSSMSGHDSDCVSDDSDRVASSSSFDYCAGQGCVAGTAPYQPPEVFREDTIASQLGPEVDVWSIGCALYEAVTCQSLPLEPPYIGQLAMKPETWKDTWENLFKIFSENVDIMVACALGDGSSLSMIKKKQERLNEKRILSSPQFFQLLHNQTGGGGGGGISCHKEKKHDNKNNNQNKKGTKKDHYNFKHNKNKKNNFSKEENDNNLFHEKKNKNQFESNRETRNEIVDAGLGLCILLSHCLNPDPKQRPQLSMLLSSADSSSSQQDNGGGGVGGTSLRWLKAFQTQPLRFGHAFGKPNVQKKKDMAKDLDNESSYDEGRSLRAKSSIYM